MRNRILFTLILFFAVANILIWSLLGWEKAYAQRVYPGVWLSTEPLAGLTRDQVVTHLQPLNDKIRAEKITLVLLDKTYQPTLADLGYTVNLEAMADQAFKAGRGNDVKSTITALLNFQRARTVPLAYTVDQGKFDDYLNTISSEVTKSPKDASLIYKGGQLSVVPGEEGLVLNKEELRQQIQSQVRPNYQPTITLAYKRMAPVVADQSQLTEAMNYVQKLLAKPLTVQAEEVSDSYSGETVYGLISYEVKEGKLVATIDSEKVKQLVTGFAKKVDTKAVDKQVSLATGETLREGSNGRTLNQQDLAARISARLTAADLDTPLVATVKAAEAKTVQVSPEYTLGRKEGRYIEVDLSTQRMHLIEGNQYHKTFIISTGKWDMPTPIGEFSIRNHYLDVGSKRYAPLRMKYWMAITGDGAYGIHQLPYWPGGRQEGTNHLGTPVSHGCIRLGPEDAPYVYEWATDGTAVFIHA